MVGWHMNELENDYVDGNVVAVLVLPPVLIVMWGLLVLWISNVLAQLKLDAEWDKE
jgi:asparagine N-glycosylation enzyme membrane subunit Stt3